eukprot:TRINITY_DN7417_c0_g1_i3.p1 TRINITY_DN7417_c0_g1~~TRINITY_DN7417_c0_g1_i3.p1  ORF type:complete len:264 (+),score=27.08 TRINITY_DN7417_c0_g1_i3:117-794(+)
MFEQTSDKEWWQKANSKIQIYDKQFLDEELLVYMYLMDTYCKVKQGDFFRLDMLPYGYQEAVELYIRTERSKWREQIGDLQGEIVGLLDEFKVDTSNDLVDILALSSDGQNYAIMIDDQNQYFWSQQGRITGQLQMRNRILKKLGYLVVPIVKQKWEQMSPEEKRGYLRISMDSVNSESKYTQAIEQTQEAVESGDSEKEEEDQEEEQLDVLNLMSGLGIEQSQQ